MRLTAFLTGAMTFALIIEELCESYVLFRPMFPSWQRPLQRMTELGSECNQLSVTAHHPWMMQKSSSQSGTASTTRNGWRGLVPADHSYFMVLKRSIRALRSCSSNRAYLKAVESTLPCVGSIVRNLLPTAAYWCRLAIRHPDGGVVLLTLPECLLQRF